MSNVTNPVDVYVREGPDGLGVRIGTYRRTLSPEQARALACALNEKANLADHGNEAAPDGSE